MNLPEKPFQYKMLIDGNWIESESKERYERKSPAHNVPVGEYPAATVEDVNNAVATAHRKFIEGQWPKMKGADRAKIIGRVGDLIRKNKEELGYIECLESGKPITQAIDEMVWAAGIWDYAATLPYHTYGDSYNTLGENMLAMTIREPLGVVGMITPWNFPLLIISQKLPFALAVGCTTVTKPAEITSGTTIKLHELLLQAGVPAGVANVVTGSGGVIGNCLSQHPDISMISFTGSTEVGKKVLQNAKSNVKKVELELGGKNPQLVFADCDFDAAVDAVVFGVFFNQGECCNSGSRLLIQDEIADEFVQAVIKKSKTVPIGDPLDPKTKVGAIVSESQFNTIMNYVKAGEKEGAELRLGGKQMITKTGRYIEPTIFDKVSPEMSIANDEIFGPVLSVLRFKTKEEAINIANDSIYGLSASVWTKDIDTAITLSRKLEAGTVWINTFMDGFPELCFGGYKESGLGRELGHFAVEEFTELKTILMHTGPRDYWWKQPEK
ncbi:MAG: sorbosone dehydrogenase [Euryarchaeota archaeon]|jgi:betaine-aldehyde dehydrogenase|nr:sorbosone dehydrogenase [Euryarchaeota archaeon]|tara:strand:- start:560 stop:2050 length:1491 start_codon:yes stop_codon:yes gene_type:complete